MESGVWVKCPGGCDDYWCTLHKAHAWECECPDLEGFLEAGAWPYAEDAGASEWSGASSPRRDT